MKNEKWMPYWLILPTILLLAFLYGYPIILIIWQSFNKVNLLNSSMEFIGLANYKAVFKDPIFYKTIYITVRYTVITVFLKVSLGFLFAYLLHKEMFFKKGFRFLLLIPWAIPQVAVATSWSWILNGDYGYLNYILMKLQLISKPIWFLSSPKLAFYAASFVDTWMGIPMMCMMFLAGLEAIPNSLYEAAKMDGASRFKQFKDITLPGIKKVSTTILILVTIWTFNSFNVIFVLTGGGPMRATETMIIKVYNEAFSRFNLGMAATLSVITMVILSIMTFVYLKGLDFYDEE